MIKLNSLGVFEQEKKQSCQFQIFDEPVPTSSIFKMDSTKTEFEVKAKVETPPPRTSFTKPEEINQYGVSSLSGNSHTHVQYSYSFRTNDQERLESLELITNMRGLLS